jgi:two-component sensor histidine kinase
MLIAARKYYRPEEMKTTLLAAIRIALLSVSLAVTSITIAQAQPETYFKPVYYDTHSLLQLKKLVAATGQDTSRVKYLLVIADHFMSRPEELKADMDSTERYLKAAETLALRIGSELWLHQTLMAYGQFYREKLMPEEQIQVYRRAIIRAQQHGHKELEARAWFFYSYNMLFDSRAQEQRIQLAASAIYTSLYAQNSDKLAAIAQLKLIADWHLQRGFYELAEKEMLRVIAFHESIGYREIYYSYDLMSAIYNHKGDLSKALYYALLTLKSCEKVNKKLDGIFIRRLAEAYSAIGKRKESIAWFTKSLNFYIEYKDPFCIQVLYELNRELIANGEIGKALEFVQSTRKKMPSGPDSYQFWFNMVYAETYTATKQFNKAAPYIKKIIIETQTNKRQEETNTQMNFSTGQFYMAQKKYREAYYYLDKAAKANIKANLPLLIELYKQLFEIDMILHKPEDAIVNLQKYHKLQDSVFTQEKQNTIERLQIEFSASQKETENELLRKKSQLQAQQLDRDEMIKKSTFGGLAFLMIVLILLYNRFNLKKRVYAILIKQKKAIDTAYAKLEVSFRQKNVLIADKERLIKEVHHRVNNNLQLTMSLLNSQSYYLEDQAAIAAIRESQHRIKSIALIHQKLYQTENVATINIHPYVSELVDYLRDSIGAQRKISFTLDMINLEMDIAQAVPLGLFLNEAITNIFKYAFPDNRSGKVLISLANYDETKYILKIKDNGVGLPEDFDKGKSNTLGMTLMKGLSAQMDAELAMENDHGLTITLLFENRESQPLVLNN